MTRTVPDSSNKAINNNVIYAETGRTGLTRFGGSVYEEWLRDLQGSKGVRVYKEMRDNDSVVGAFLFAVEMLLRNVDWRVEKAGDTPQDEEAKEFLESCLYDMSQSWQDTLAEILSLLPFGWCYMETIYKKRVGPDEVDSTKKSQYSDGRIGWRKWAIRAQETLYEWGFDEEGGILGMTQIPPPDYRTRYISIDRALLFRTRVTKGNPEGRSILRNAYRPWYMKKNIEDIEGIGIERDLAGLPVIWLPPEILAKKSSEAQLAYNEYKKLIQNIKRDEQEGVMMPLVYDDKGNKIYDLTLLSTGSRRQFDTNQIITRYDQRIAMTVMADFLLLGHDKVGSFALSSSKTDLFALALGAILKSIADVINTHAVPRLFNLNTFTNLSGPPQVVPGDVESPDLIVLGDFIQKLSGAGATLFPDDELETYLRQVANFPKKSDTLVTPSEPVADTDIQDALLGLVKSSDKDREFFIQAVKDLVGEVQKNDSNTTR